MFSQGNDLVFINTTQAFLQNESELLDHNTFAQPIT